MDKDVADHMWYAISFVKILLRIRPVQRFLAQVLISIAETWVFVNGLILSLMHNVEFDVDMPDSLRYGGWYMVTCNHQSWVDIVVLQKIFWRKIPFLKFFLKQELIKVPLLGMAWWALDFPFMKRFSKEYLTNHPEMKGKDLETTKKACEKFKETPVSVMNFAEGTRFSVAKKTTLNSPYKNLLIPKSGGMAFVLSAMGGQLHSMVDVTIVYQDEHHEFWDLMFGRINKISIRVIQRPIPDEMALGDYEGDPKFRGELQQWLGGIWQEKDELISRMKNDG